jgi:hypothetical protein
MSFVRYGLRPAWAKTQIPSLDELLQRISLTLLQLRIGLLDEQQQAAERRSAGLPPALFRGLNHTAFYAPSRCCACRH